MYRVGRTETTGQVLCPQHGAQSAGSPHCLLSFSHPCQYPLFPINLFKETILARILLEIALNCYIVLEENWHLVHRFPSFNTGLGVITNIMYVESYFEVLL